MPQMQNGAVGIALGDFDRDGFFDLIVAGRKVKEMGSNYGLFVLKGDGKGGFKELTATNLPEKGLSVSWGVAVGDVNEDGLLDFAAATGGAVAGGASKGQPVPPKRGDKAAQKPSDKNAFRCDRRAAAAAHAGLGKRRSQVVRPSASASGKRGDRVS